MGALFEYLIITIMAVFVIVNPLTTAFVFAALLPRAAEPRRRLVAKRATIVATVIFFVFATLGGVIFQLFGITLAAFRIAGGVILFGIAMNMIRTRNHSAEEEAREKKGDLVDDVSVVPLAIPFISGPGSIATVMILTSEAPDVYHLALVYLAVVITTATCYLTMVHSRYIVQRLGDTGMDIMTKVFGLILAVIAVQFLINGIGEAVGDFMARRMLAA
ncbi:NAAT family transporter [Ectothiorhodospiraceae bacterium 2226]|nr:NAAT family transporter [Ectothiorhodospiraceae bacterium 2226]